MSKLTAIFKTLKDAGFSDEDVSKFAITYTSLVVRALSEDDKYKTNSILDQMYPESIRYKYNNETYILKPGDSLWLEKE